jgi:hypothetical protein
MDADTRFGRLTDHGTAFQTGPPRRLTGGEGRGLLIMTGETYPGSGLSPPNCPVATPSRTSPDATLMAAAGPSQTLRLIGKCYEPTTKAHT